VLRFHPSALRPCSQCHHQSTDSSTLCKSPASNWTCHADESEFPPHTVTPAECSKGMTLLPSPRQCPASTAHIMSGHVGIGYEIHLQGELWIILQPWTNFFWQMLLVPVSPPGVGRGKHIIIDLPEEITFPIKRPWERIHFLPTQPSLHGNIPQPTDPLGLRSTQLQSHYPSVPESEQKGGWKWHDRVI